jgi:hypothetical protein
LSRREQEETALGKKEFVFLTKCRKALSRSAGADLGVLLVDVCFT